MSTHFFIRRIYHIDRDFEIASNYIKKTSKTKMNICSEGPFTPFPPWVEFLNLINLRKSANPNTYIR